MTSDIADLVARLRKGIHYLPRMATEDSEEYRAFRAAGDAIAVNEGDLWMALMDMQNAATALEAIAAERDEARRIIAACASALPNGAFIDAERASLKFMASLPAEIAAVCAALSLQQEDVSK